MADMEKNTDQGQNQNQEPNNQGRLFTQEEVNQIVKKRLERQKTENQLTDDQIAERTAALEARSNLLDCREYLLEKDYPHELLDALSTSDVEAFKQKADTVYKLIEQRTVQPVAPLGSGEPIITKNHDPIAAAFNHERKHDPKPWPPRFDE